MKHRSIGGINKQLIHCIKYLIYKSLMNVIVLKYNIESEMTDTG